MDKGKQKSILILQSGRSCSLVVLRSDRSCRQERNRNTPTVGLARTIYIVYIRYFWQGNHQIHGHIRCIYTVLANPSQQGIALYFSHFYTDGGTRAAVVVCHSTVAKRLSTSHTVQGNGAGIVHYSTIAFYMQI
jgi:hypothetical protein